MDWTVVTNAGGGADDLIERAMADVPARSLVRWERSSPPEVLARIEGGILVIGPDALLASVAHTLYQNGRRGPVLFAAGPGSDLLRMFALGSTDLRTRARAGAPYPCDLGICRIGGQEVPFVSHIVAGSRGSLTGADITVERGSRTATTRGWKVVIANAQHVNGSLLAPRSAVMDGQLDVQIFGGRLHDRPTIYRASRRGLHLSHRHVWRRQAESASVVIPTGWHVSVDARRAGKGPFDVSAARDAFDLWI